MDEKVKAAPQAAATAKSAQEDERKTLEDWAAKNDIGPYKPGTENHNCHLAGLRMLALARFGAFHGAEMTRAEFIELCDELTKTPIGYQVHGLAPRKGK